MSWGGDIIHWQKSSAGCYFIPQQEIPCQFVFPHYVFSENLTLAKIERVKNNYIELQRKFSKEKEQSVKEAFDSLTGIFINDKPFRYYFITPLVLTKQFLAHSGSFYLPIHATNPCFNRAQMVIKVCESLLYWVSLLIGLPFLLVLGWKKKIYILPFIPLMLILLFPVFLKASEWRYFRTTLPILFIGFVYFSLTVKEMFAQKNNS